jgi:translation initiation factor 4A
VFFLISLIVVIESNWDEQVDKFDELDLKEPVLRGIYGYGFVKPSPIQQKGILPVIQGRDTIAQVSWDNITRIK